MRMLLKVALSSLALVACAHGPTPKARHTAEIHFDLGLEAMRGGRAPDALHEFELALAADSDFAEAHYGRGLVLERGFGRAEEAEREYRTALALKPHFPDADNALGQLLARAGRYDEAIKLFDAALGEMTYREPWVAHLNKGLAFYSMGRKAEGIEEMRASIALAPSYCGGHRELGRTLTLEGRFKDAITEFSEYARICDKTPDAQLQLGLARMKSGDVDGAREALKRCVELGSSVPEGEQCRRTLELLR